MTPSDEDSHDDGDEPSIHGDFPSFDEKFESAEDWSPDEASL
jgi:hypothetical protein